MGVAASTVEAATASCPDHRARGSAPAGPTARTPRRCKSGTVGEEPDLSSDPDQGVTVEAAGAADDRSAAPATGQIPLPRTRPGTRAGEAPTSVRRAGASCWSSGSGGTVRTAGRSRARPAHPHPAASSTDGGPPHTRGSWPHPPPRPPRRPGPSTSSTESGVPAPRPTSPGASTGAQVSGQKVEVRWFPGRPGWCRGQGWVRRRCLG